MDVTKNEGAKLIVEWAKEDETLLSWGTFQWPYEATIALAQGKLAS